MDSRRLPSPSLSQLFFFTPIIVLLRQMSLSWSSIAGLLLSLVTTLVAVAMFYFAAHPQQYALPVALLLPGCEHDETVDDLASTRKRHGPGHRAGSAPRVNPRAVSESLAISFR